MKEFYVYLRPLTIKFLKSMAKDYQIIAYSNLESKMLNHIADLIEKEGRVFDLCVVQSKDSDFK